MQLGKTLPFTILRQTEAVSETISSNGGLFIIGQVMKLAGIIQEYM
ncbi:hypothetical protein SARI_01734 [Salmonella enterica subsp. arizonae serovar 62:z4,z23:-]|uniref:Uncharacterized protein n=1 Tax=Salmonella arizonae (strain ATCC BAA-731 / CDC346-86 / RSK2980) TaxID=41514 RepID=A9MG59_SALAR|nr:hypothetical protein SARI_01734 [Salmonella enterica subsp. arizonae serovar 62:z4,z23:-]